MAVGAPASGARAARQAQQGPINILDEEQSAQGLLRAARWLWAGVGTHWKRLRIACAVRPGKFCEILPHLSPNSWTDRTISASSALLHANRSGLGLGGTLGAAFGAALAASALLGEPPSSASA